MHDPEEQQQQQWSCRDHATLRERACSQACSSCGECSAEFVLEHPAEFKSVQKPGERAKLLTSASLLDAMSRWSFKVLIICPACMQQSGYHRDRTDQKGVA